MDSTYPPEAWKRLGRLLEQRRGQLGYGFRQRDKFLRDRGGPPPSLKMLARLERGERASYPPGTVTLLESLYELEPGSFEAALKGGELFAAAGQARRPDVTRPDADDWHPSMMAQILFRDDEVLQRIYDLPRPADEGAAKRLEDEKAAAIQAIKDVREELFGEERPPAEGTALASRHLP